MSVMREVTFSNDSYEMFAGLMNCLHGDGGITPSILFQIYYFGEC